MEHVLKFDEFMKNKCGGGIKRKYYVYKGAWEIGKRKNGSCKLCVMCQKEKKIYEENRHMKKKMKEKKSEKKKNTKQRMCMLWENRSIDENEGKMGQKDDICPYYLNMLY